ncbi:DUF234 domain-containing protein [Nonomuraea sp. NPDC046570]|uniref:ATP-binding protein n=1 Tax=Nonomuraea sp. NPDC046570 TaxID=3155255 RepID=UPI0033F9FBE9
MGRSVIKKPERVFARDEEWAALVEFATSPANELRLGIVSGRRRQGKTFLLQDLAEAVGGFHFVAVEATERDALRQYGIALAAHLEVGGQLTFANWDEAIGYTLDRCADRVVIIDEFPYLIRSSPSLPSILQREVDARGEGRGRGRLLLCGSAMSVMGGLLGGQAPLRGRASLELVVQPFDYRTAARFWNLGDPRLAVLVHAIVGGTPAYRKRFVDDDSPSSLEAFDDWVVRRVLSGRAPLLREARYLLSNESDVRDEALYHAVLGAIAAGNNRRGNIASYMERKSTDIAHPLAVLEDCRLIQRQDDALNKGKPHFRIVEPLITFYESVIRPSWTRLELGHAAETWRDSRSRFLSQVVGPHFESLCREFAMRAEASTFGGFAGEVSAGTVARSIEIDVVVLSPSYANEKRRLLSLGECKWGEVMDPGHLARLRDARDLIHMKGYDTRDTVLACYSGAGFDERLRQEARRDPRVLLVDLDRLYG